MKILQLGKFFPIKGGVEKVMYDLTMGFSKRGISCDMLCASSDNSFKAKHFKLNEFANIFVEPSLIEVAKTKISFSLILKLKKICKEYDVIHIHHPDPLVALALFFSGYKGSVILHWHSDILKQKTFLKFYKYLQNWLIHRSNAVIVTSPNYLEGSDTLQKTKHKTYIVPIGIVDPLNFYSEEIVDKIKLKFNNKKMIFSLGRLVPYKGFEYLIDAAKDLPDDFVILIGGNGSLKKDLESRIIYNNLTDKVKLLGFLEERDMYSYFKAADLFCLSSIEKTEAFAIVQLEAMAFSKPIVATNILGSGVPWVNKNLVSGINVQPKNSLELAKGITSLLENDNLYKQISVSSRNRFLNEFTLDKSLDKIYDIYLKIIRNS